MAISRRKACQWTHDASNRNYSAGFVAKGKTRLGKEQRGKQPVAKCETWRIWEQRGATREVLHHGR